MENFLLVNITWNPYGWKNNKYINPKAGHRYAKTHVGGESLNFHFDKKPLDNQKFIHGYAQWTNSPVNFENGGLIIFYSRNTDIGLGQIVGVYGKVKIEKNPKTVKIAMQKNDYWTNLKAEKDFSMLFPLPLESNNYKINPTDKIVGQIGYSYKSKDFAEKILFEELTAMYNVGANENDFKKLVNIYEFYIGKTFKLKYVSNDEKEQLELEKYYKTKSRLEILEDLKNLKETDAEEIIVKHKSYKRDNKTIAQIKIIRDFKCQLCGIYIPKKNGEKYIEAAHIIPKHKKGRECPENIILLCPNHHKEFDLGALEIIKQYKEKFEFILNTKRYNLIQSLDTKL